MSHPLTSLPSWILSSASTRSHQILHKGLAVAGVDGYEYRCLMPLVARSPLSQAELGDAAALDPRDVTHTVRRLEGRDLVARTKDPNHGRKVLVTLTRRGRATTNALVPVMALIQERIFGGLNAEERATLLRLLGRVGRSSD